MINASRLAMLSVLAAGLALTTPAAAQVTDAQRSAIRSACRSDYQKNCASVTPGGAEALQCLQKNIASLSSACASAVHAVETAAAPKAEPAVAPKAESKTESAPAESAKTEPAKTEPVPAPAKTEAAAPKSEPAPGTAVAKPAPGLVKPAPAAKSASAPAGKPTDAQVAAIRSACRSDYPTVCAGVPTGGAEALQCLEKNKAKVAAGCQQALNAVSGGSAAPAAGAALPHATAAAPATAATAPAAPPAKPLVLRPMLPREELFVLRSACGADVRTLCGGVAPGGGRIIQCLAVRAESLSPACKDVLAQFAAQ